MAVVSILLTQGSWISAVERGRILALLLDVVDWRS